MSCATEDQFLNSEIDPYTIDLAKVDGSRVVTEIATRLETIDGQSITDVSQLKPQSDYYLIVESKNSVFVRIGLKGNFEIIQDFNVSKTPVTNFIYHIRLTGEIANGLPMSVIVMHKLGNRFVRESPKRFILFNKNTKYVAIQPAKTAS